MKTKNIYQFRGWVGVDASDEISLFEYGLLFNPKENECNVIYGIERDKDGEENIFGTCYETPFKINGRK